MKRILNITLEFPPQVGGIATAVFALVHALEAKSGLVLAPEHPQARSFDKAQAYEIYRKNFFLPRPLWPRWLILAWHVGLILRRDKVDLLFVHHVLPVGYVATLAKFFYRVPFLVFIHGTDSYLSARTGWKRMITAFVLSQAQGVIFNSNFLRQRLQAIIPSVEKKSAVVYPCPEKIFFVAPPPAILDSIRERHGLLGKTVILCVTRLVPGKGVSHIINNLPELLNRVSNIILVVVGDGPMLAQLESQAQALSVAHAIRFVGECPHVDMPNWYGVADLFVLLTHPRDGREEGLGLAFLEAGAMGIAIVAGRSGGVEETVIHNETGLLVDTENKLEVVSAIISLLTNKEEAARLGRGAAERTKKVFQWSQQIKHLEPWIF